MKIIAPMSGNVWKVLVAIGGTVQEGDEVVILESMKMEIPIHAEGSGSVKEVKVAEGDFIQEGETVVELE